MTSHRSARLVAEFLVLGLTAALLATATPSSAVAGRGHGHGHKGKVVWDSTAFYAGAGAVAAHGRVPRREDEGEAAGQAARRLANLRQDQELEEGKFAISGTLDWYGTHKVRVSTAGRHRFNRSKKVDVFTTYAPRGNPADHAFLTHRGVRYSVDPCKTIKYAVNADDVGAGGIYLAQVGMAQLSWATGIKVRYVGTSHQIPFQTEVTRLPAKQNLLIAWADEAEIPRFVTDPAIGIGGPFRIKRARDGAGRRVLMSTQGAVVLNTNAYNSGDYTQGYFGLKPVWGKTILHELGHAFGLDHVTPADEMMHPGAVQPNPDGSYSGLYGAGDLAGLATNGLGQGCFRKDNRSRDGARARIQDPQPLP